MFPVEYLPGAAAFVVRMVADHVNERPAADAKQVCRPVHVNRSHFFSPFRKRTHPHTPNPFKAAAAINATMPMAMHHPMKR